MFTNQTYFKIEHTMQLVTPGGKGCCVMANDVQNSRLAHSFINIMHCI